MILITGKNGQVGWELQRTLMPLGNIVAVGVETVDFTDADSVIRMIRASDPDIIVNAAAYTNVDTAEKELELAMKVNGTAPGLLAEEAKKREALLVHYSTDYVFNGKKQSAYVETDCPDPLNAYGKTKFVGEKAIQEVDGDHFILRTSWVYGTRGNNFLLTMLRLMKEKETLQVVDDQVGAPTWARLIAETTAQILKQILNVNKKEKFSQYGVFHLTSSGRVSWYCFAKKILELIEKQGHGNLLKIKKINPVSAEQYSAPVNRPMNSCMATDKLEQQFGLTMPAWDEALALCMDDLR